VTSEKSGDSGYEYFHIAPLLFLGFILASLEVSFGPNRNSPQKFLPVGVLLRRHWAGSSLSLAGKNILDVGLREHSSGLGGIPHGPGRESKDQSYAQVEEFSRSDEKRILRALRDVNNVSDFLIMLDDADSPSLISKKISFLHSHLLSDQRVWEKA
jgi:hypothetical protein